MSTPLLVTARLDTPSVGLDRHPLMLDGPLSWAYAMHALAHNLPLERVTKLYAPDLPLPLDRWEQDGTWGWCTSRARFTVEAYTAIQIRRKPATQAMARYSPDRKHHAGLGPMKARDTTLQAAWIRRIEWDVLATDPTELAALLQHITHMGERHRNGLGHVTKWTIAPSHQPDAWRDRPMPGDGQPMRAPYWHPSRRVA
jgi:hypothetical protein